MCLHVSRSYTARQGRLRNVLFYKVAVPLPSAVLVTRTEFSEEHFHMQINRILSGISYQGYAAYIQDVVQC